MHNSILHLFDYLNTIILIYFLTANSIYTLLMMLSLYSVSLHSKFAKSMGYQDVMDSPATPPVALIIPAHNEQDAIEATVRSVMALNYPEKEIIVVDDGSTDLTSQRLIEKFQLVKMDLIYRAAVPCKQPFAFYYNPDYPELILLIKENGGKSDALNAGINMARSPYFCTVDADSLIEKDALLRLMAPVIHSSVSTVVSGGVVRISNGCSIEHGQVENIALPRSWVERCQIVEYIRTFLFGRPGWNLLQATFICSGAFCLLHKETVVLAGGFSTDTVTEDVDMIATLHSFLRKKGWKYQMVFTTDPICWTEAPKRLTMLARQRRRWQLGLMQTVVKHSRMIWNPRYGLIGGLSMPFHAYIEAIGCVVEALGTILIPLSFVVGAMPFGLFLLLMFLAVGYGTLLSVGSVLLFEATVRRYPRVQDGLLLILYAFVENFGYRQVLTFMRAQGVLQFFKGRTKWEHVEHGLVQQKPMVEAADA
jgi:cellulose synthase/poly-beta-1,6-N-acetylglucosamine synthase-like glycosyltransferase